jgi:NDP-sugar pyrophosphorylase family protein
MREAGGRVLDIQEKQPDTDDRMNEYASSGTYYFRSGEVMSRALAETRRRELQVNGEFYVSLAYKPMLDAGQDVRVYALQHFMQWGTPEDVAEYRGWSDAFRALQNGDVGSVAASGAVIVPMAGMGQRFAREGYALTKPLIPVSGRPMVLQAANDLPSALQHAFVLRADMPGRADIGEALLNAYPAAVLHDVPSVTEGQACSAEVGLQALAERVTSVAGPITFGACDNGALYDRAAFDRLMARGDVDVVVWVARGHTNAVRHPQMFGWVDVDESGAIRRVSVKQPLAQPASDPIVIGTFTFKQQEHFEKALKRLIEQNDRINGEFYLDSTINHALALGMRCHVFEVDHFFSWGTPNDLRTFEYWQSCFDKWPSHPYVLERDQRVPSEAVEALRARYAWAHPEPQGVGK